MFGTMRWMSSGTNVVVIVVVEHDIHIANSSSGGSSRWVAAWSRLYRRYADRSSARGSVDWPLVAIQLMSRSFSTVRSSAREGAGKRGWGGGRVSEE